jgi:hypothetical protein
MKCRPFKLCAFLLLGAIVNVAVAWGCAIRTQQDGYWLGRRHAKCSSAPWPAPVPLAWPTAANDVCIVDVMGATRVIAWFRPASEDEVYYEQCVLTAGLPLRAVGQVQEMGTVQFGWTDADRASVPQAWREAVVLKRGAAGLPVHPLWPAFALNTLVYGAICWPLFATPFTLRRQLRRRRNLCPHCAYPIGTNEVCTECGKPLPPHKAGLE